MTTLKCSICNTLVISNVFDVDDVITCKECW
jgi:DNA-directed RNA polymerase subunit RPC12/RpoP